MDSGKHFHVQWHFISQPDAADRRSTAMHDTPDDALGAPASGDDRPPIGWGVLALLIAAGSASAAVLLDATLTPLLIVVGLGCLVYLERIWRP
jgi:hypothetical protein